MIYIYKYFFVCKVENELEGVRVVVGEIVGYKQNLDER